MTKKKQNPAARGASPSTAGLDGEYVNCTMDENCVLCIGEACNLCGAGLRTYYPQLKCEHDVLDRHREPSNARGEPRAACGASDSTALLEGNSGKR